MSSNIKEIAKVLGSRGGRARAKSLTSEQRRSIAKKGALARLNSLEAARRIRINFQYVETVRCLAPKTSKIIRVKRCSYRLPSVNGYAKK